MLRPARSRFPLLLSGSMLVVALSFGLAGCSDDDDGDGNEADKLGVGAACASTDECPEVDYEGGTGGGTDGSGKIQLQCLPQFTGGYCGLPDCMSSEDCPQGSDCVAHTDGRNYCFRQCTDKAECNRNRPAEAEANCSANFDYADPADDMGLKACIPPSSGA